MTENQLPDLQVEQVRRLRCGLNPCLSLGRTLLGKPIAGRSRGHAYAASRAVRGRNSGAVDFQTMINIAVERPDDRCGPPHGPAQRHSRKGPLTIPNRRGPSSTPEHLLTLRGTATSILPLARPSSGCRLALRLALSTTSSLQFLKLSHIGSRKVSDTATLRLSRLTQPWCSGDFRRVVTSISTLDRPSAAQDSTSMSNVSVPDTSIAFAA
jgi:hypothetical protein